MTTYIKNADGTYSYQDEKGGYVQNKDGTYTYVAKPQVTKIIVVVAKQKTVTIACYIINLIGNCHTIELQTEYEQAWIISM